MKVKLQFLTVMASLALLGNAMAQSITISTEVVIKGDTAVVDLAFVEGGATTNLDITMTYDETVVDESAITADCSAGTGIGLTFFNCSVDTTNNQVKGIGGNFSGNALTSGALAAVSFPVLDSAATGDSVNPFAAGFSASGTVTPFETTWTLTVTDGPQPAWGDTLSDPGPDAMSGQITTTIESFVIINNDNGQDGSTLDYTCTETSDPDGKFSQTGNMSGSIAKGSTEQITIACDSSVVGSFSGAIECTHNGNDAGDSSPVGGPMNCTVTAGPEPAYSGVAAGLAMVATEQGDPDPAGSVTITNSGDAGTTLTGTCTISGDTQISVSNGAFSVAQGAAGSVVGVACDASAEGAYTATLSCAHNGTNVATPVDYAVSCDVGPPGPAVFSSVPADGATIEMTPEDVPVGAVVPDQVLTITNAAAEANDRDLGLSNCAFTGSAEITATAAPATIAPMASADVTFSCSTAAVGDYTGTYSCDYTETGGEPTGTATYTVNCGVRAASSDIAESPMSGTNLNILVPILGTGQTSVSFAEILDEGVDATVDSCSFGTANFAVVTTLPATVAAGSSVNVDLTGSDPGTGEISFTDTLTCTYTDSDSAPGTASWPITLTVLAQPIPTLSTWGLMLMILTLMGLGGIVIRRKVLS